MIYDPAKGTVHDYYLSECQRLICPGSRALKTDLDNEVNQGYASIPGGIIGNVEARWTAIEYDPKVVQKARDRKVNAYLIQGDIRKLQVAPSWFDVVVDLSTLDHIPTEDIPLALTGYWRSLSVGGLLILFVWCGESVSFPEWQPTQQYAHPLAVMRDQLRALFRIEEQQETIHNGERVLVEFICRKAL